MTDLSRMKTQSKSVSVTQMERAWARVLGEPGGGEAAGRYFRSCALCNQERGRENGRSDNPTDLESYRI